jgi:hypothetical protein
MTPPKSFEKVSAAIVSMNKAQLQRQIKGFRGNFKLDFSDAYIKGCTVDKLRHILLAAVMTKR